MLDKRTSILLSGLLEQCAEGGYKVLEEDDLLSLFPARLNVDSEEIAQMMRYLEEHKYIEIRYAEEGVYCASVLPEGRMYSENVREAKTTAGRRRRDTVLMTALGAFLGAFLGSILAWLITLAF